MRSLRSRLSLLVASGLFVVTAAAVTGVAFERWQEDQSTLDADVEIAAIRLSESSNPLPPTVSLPAGVDAYAVIFDDQANVLGQSRDLPDSVIEELLDEVWTQTSGAEVLFTVELGTAANPTIVAGTGCVDATICDTVAVGVSEESLGSYLLPRLGWILGAAALAAALGAVAARWVVGRSLKPVDQMRSELDGITASHITTADLGRRVPVPGTGDELTLLGESMNATLDRLGSAVTANERFVADAAHELRSPITGVRAALEVERSKQPNSLLDDSVTELDRASRLVDDLLVLARRQSGATQRIDVDLDDLARTAVSHLRARHPDLQIDVTLAPCRVIGSEDDLRRVVGNLLDNAARYGEGHLKIATGHTTDQAWAVLQVEDNGPGIAAEHRTMVFERFARLDESRARATGGSGLGLAIARELVEDHGGSIAVTDSDLGGAGFTVWLPV